MTTAKTRTVTRRLHAVEDDLRAVVIESHDDREVASSVLLPQEAVRLYGFFPMKLWDAALPISLYTNVRETTAEVLAETCAELSTYVPRPPVILARDVYTGNVPKRNPHPTTISARDWEMTYRYLHEPALTYRSLSKEYVLSLSNVGAVLRRTLDRLDRAVTKGVAEMFDD